MLRRLALLVVLALSAVAPSAGAQDLGSLVRQLAEGGFGEREQTINGIAALGDPAGAHALAALGEGDLYQRKSDKSVFIAVREGRRYKLTDPLTGEAAGEAARREVDKIRVNNQLRRVIRNALGALTLRNPNRAKRLEAAESLFKSRDPDAVEALDVAIAAETDSSVLAAMRQARAAGVLAGDAPEEAKIEALGVVAERGDRDALALLSNTRNAAQGALKDAAEAAIDRVESSLALWGALQNVWYGLSLGSVLLLAAIGLAITFGVMGVINMAHGEMVMLGAYTTFVVQETIRNSAPWLFDWSLAIAIPLAFLVAGGVGILIERGIIRFLYQRPLETLLATWGLSLILQQTVRSMFGPTNQEVGNPSWMAGAFELGNLTITYNRMWIIFFALLVIGALVLLFKMTSFGLQMRAVTQNRNMARAMGIRTPLIDALTFGLGSGIAGIAGVALSQIDNVSPNLGQGYIVDSFMVVVFGGVGNVWGTLVGAMTLGITNKFLEPYAGAVLGKILVLVFIILFIQKRPRGLFAPKGRAVEA